MDHGTREIIAMGPAFGSHVSVHTVAIVKGLDPTPPRMTCTGERLKAHPTRRARSSQCEEAQQLNGCDDNTKVAA